MTKFSLIVFKEQAIANIMQMETEISSDIGEEVISKLKEIIERLDRIIKAKDEKEFKDPLLDRVTT